VGRENTLRLPYGPGRECVPGADSGCEEDIDCGDDAVTLPNFLVIEAMKAGTVSLHNYLAEHPDVFVGDGATFGEPHFFVAEQNWPRGRGWYESLLDGADGTAAIGEGSPGSTWAHVYRGVPERIAQLIPQARLIYLVRDPVARMQSMYMHQVSAGRERRRVEAALLDERYLWPSRYGFQHRCVPRSLRPQPDTRDRERSASPCARPCGFSDLLPGWISRYLGAVAIFKQSGSDPGSPRLRSRLAARPTSYLRLLWTTPVFIGLTAAGVYAIGHGLGEHTSWPSALWPACSAGAASAALDARRIRKRREAEGVPPKILKIFQI
jgi:hypothetical protein